MNKIIMIRESVATSFIRDTYSFAVLAGTTLATNTLMPPSGWINCIIAVTWFLWMVGKANRHRLDMTPQEARQWLDVNFPQDGKGGAA